MSNRGKKPRWASFFASFNKLGFFKTFISTIEIKLRFHSTVQMVVNTVVTRSSYYAADLKWT